MRWNWDTMANKTKYSCCFRRKTVTPSGIAVLHASLVEIDYVLEGCS